MECLAKQAIRTAKNVDFCEIGLIGQESKKVLGNYQKEVLAFFAEKFGIVFGEDIEIPPTLLAVVLYDKISQVLQNNAPYSEIKKQSIIKARKIKEKLLERMALMPKEDRLAFAISCAVLGNVIDYGAEHSYDIEEESNKIFHTDFAYFHLEALLERLRETKKLVYIGDNAGENELDEILIEVLKDCYPQMQIFYFVRGMEIINDITLNDLKNSHSRLFTLCEVVDSGVPSPGFIYPLANVQSQTIFKEVDLVFAKGMGNFESMEKIAREDSRIFFLFKIKCNVIADYLNKKLGELVLLSPYILHKGLVC